MSAAPPPTDPDLERVVEVARRASNVLCACHAGPDGDAAGSTCATAALLAGLGKRVTLYAADPIPPPLRFLPRARELVTRLHPSARFDATFVHDCAEPRLLGTGFPGPAVTGTLVVLDHHPSEVAWGDVVYRDVRAAAVGVLVYRLARRLAGEVAPEVGEGIYTSLLADTGGFRYANTDVEALSIAADLVGRGVDAWRCAQGVFESLAPAQLRLLAAALGTLALEVGGKVATLCVTPELLEACGARPWMLEGVVGYARAVEGVEVGVLLSADAGGAATRVSLRSRGRVDVSAVARRHQGGGHRAAAGCRLALPLAEARRALVAELEAELARS